MLFKLFTEMVTGFVAAFAKAIKSPVKNCELSEPSMVISAGCNGPFIFIGRCPLFDSIEMSSFGNISSKKCMGRFNKLPVPVIVIADDDKAAMGVNMRILRPLSPQLRTPPPPPKGGTAALLINKLPSSFCKISAPNFWIISSAARSSLLLPEFSKVVSPSASNASAQALCILLLDAGATIFPEMMEGLMVTITILFL